MRKKQYWEDFKKKSKAMKISFKCLQSKIYLSISRPTTFRKVRLNMITAPSNRDCIKPWYKFLLTELRLDFSYREVEVQNCYFIYSFYIFVLIFKLLYSDESLKFSVTSILMLHAFFANMSIWCFTKKKTIMIFFDWSYLRSIL